MSRFYRSYLGRLLLGFLILIELEASPIGKAGVQEIAARWKGSPVDEAVVHHALAEYMHGYPDEAPDNADVLKGVFGQLTKTKSDDLDLLDLIVRTLRLPFVNYFSTASVKALRDAILTPNELSELKSAVKANTKCVCGHDFSAGEAVSLCMENGLISIQCTKCQRPTLVCCDYCRGVVAITSKTNLRNTIDCGCTSRKAAAGPGDPTNLTIAQMAAQQRILRRTELRNTPTPPRRAGNTAPLGHNFIYTGAATPAPPPPDVTVVTTGAQAAFMGAPPPLAVADFIEEAMEFDE